MDRLTERITNKDTKEVLAYRVKCHKDLEAVQKLVLPYVRKRVR